MSNYLFSTIPPQKDFWGVLRLCPNINIINNIATANDINFLIHGVQNGGLTFLQQCIHTLASDLISSAQLGHCLVHIKLIVMN